MVEEFDGHVERERMVKDQLQVRGIHDPRVLSAMARVPRELFLEEVVAARAYGDHPLPIGFGQTISQPYMVAYVAQLLQLRGGERVLDVGAGSGYQAAVLAEIVRETGGKVLAVERIPELAALAARRLLALGYPVEVLCADGTQGWEAHAPFDAIAVGAGAPRIPEQLLEQLAPGGRMVVPVGDHREQRLMVIHRHGDRFDIVADLPCVYVDLIGRYGWQPEASAQTPAH